MKTVKRIPTVCFPCQNIWNVVRALSGELFLTFNSSSQQVSPISWVLGRHTEGPDSHWSKVIVEELKGTHFYKGSQPFLPLVSGSSWLLFVLLRNRTKPINFINFRGWKNIPHKKKSRWNIWKLRAEESSKSVDTMVTTQQRESGQALGRKGGDKVK